MYVVDTHCHILPGVDDGARDMDMSMKMLDIAYSQNIRKIIFTPHFYLGENMVTMERIQIIYEQVCVEAKRIYTDLELYLGNEVLWNPGIIDVLKQGKIFPMGKSKYILIEFLPSSSYQEIYDAIRRISQVGYRPVIAHVERYEHLIHNLDYLDEVCWNGAYLQMNASSLTGGFFDKEAKWCRKLVKDGYISILGTDAHNLEERAPYIQDVIHLIQKQMEQKDLEALLYKNAEKMLEGKWI